MKFLTPDLLVRFASTDDVVADAASEEWERQAAAYRDHVAAISPDLPKGAKRLLKRFNLHDARVLAITADDTPDFSIFLELPNPADPEDRNLELRYKLGGGLKNGLRMIAHPELAGDGRPFGWWQYDEFDVLKSPQLPVPVPVHSILFTGGYELQVAFFSLTCSRMRVLYRASEPEEETAKKVHELLQA